MTLRTVLTGLCWLGAAACTWLAVMFVVLHRPGFERGAAMSALFVLQSLLCLALLHGLLSGMSWRVLAFAGAIGLVLAGAEAIVKTTTGPHFEGFALIIGVLLILQGLLTAQQLITTRFALSSKVHQFGN